MKSINVNDMVRVKLTEHGILIHNHLSPFVPKHKSKDDNVIETELWSLMQIYGKYFSMTSPKIFENNEIILLEEN